MKAAIIAAALCFDRHVMAGDGEVCSWSLSACHVCVATFSRNAQSPSCDTSTFTHALHTAKYYLDVDVPCISPERAARGAARARSAAAMGLGRSCCRASMLAGLLAGLTLLRATNVVAYANTATQAGDSRSPEHSMVARNEGAKAAGAASRHLTAGNCDSTPLSEIKPVRSSEICVWPLTLSCRCVSTLALM